MSMGSPLFVVFATGFLTSFTLIAAIGAQNAFVLRQGIRREHVLPVVALCIGVGHGPHRRGHRRVSAR